MYRRLNITLPDGVLARADAFAKTERYTRSGLIARALEAFVGDAVGDVAGPEPGVANGVAEAGAAYATAQELAVAAGRHAEAASLLRAFFAARDDVEAAWIFGSADRGEAGPLSDVDIAVLGAPELGDQARWELQLDLAARLPAALAVERVDVIVVPVSSSLLMHRALVEGTRVYGERSRRAAEAEIRSANEYRDCASLRRKLDHRLTERVRRRGERR